jgi:hypothetical protein
MVGLVVATDSTSPPYSMHRSNAVMVAWNGQDASTPNYHIRADLKHAK